MKSADDKFLIQCPVEPEIPVSRLSGRVEIVRSYSFQLNMERVAGPELRYENRQFFCSAKTECDQKEATDMAAKLHSFCKGEVLKSVREQVAGWRKHDEKFIWTEVAKAS